MSESSPGSGQNAPFFVDNEVITLTRGGLWIADGVEISHEPTRKLFARSLKRDAQGWFLAIGRETKRITVEDTAYFIHRIDGSHPKGFTLWLSDETRERLDPATLSYRPARLACRIKRADRGPGHNPNGEEAKFLHAPYFELLWGMIEEKGTYWLEIEGKRFRLV